MANQRSEEDLAADRAANLNSGIPDHTGLDDVGRERLINELAPPQDNVVGNLADLQRLGAAVVEGKSTSVEDAVSTPPGVDPENASFPDTGATDGERLQSLADDVKAQEAAESKGTE